MGAEVLDDDLGLLRQVVLVQTNEARDCSSSGRCFIGRVISDGFLQTPIHLICHVTRQHVKDETLFDCLPHRIQMERLEPPGFCVLRTEQLKSLRFRGGGECKEAQVLRQPTSRYGFCQGFFHRVYGVCDEAHIFGFGNREFLLFCFTQSKA